DLNGSATDIVETTISDGVVFSISGTTSVAEGATASYTLAYAGALPDGESVTIDLTLDETDTTSGDYSDFVAALTTAAGSTAGVTFDGVDTVTFTAGIGNSLTLDFDLAMTADSNAEGSEDFSITLSDPTSSLGPIPAVDAAAADVTTNIIDGDTIEFSITGDASVAESGTSNYIISYSGTLQAGETVSVVVSLDDDAIDGTTSADYENFLTALSDAAAAGPSGVTASGNILTFDSTVSVLSLDLDMVSDTVIEGDEGFSVSLSGPASATGVDVTIDGGANSVSTTLNDESAGAVSWTLTENADPVQEGDAASYTIDFSGASLDAGHTVSINVSLLPGTAGASDFTDSLSQDLIDAASGVTGVSVSGTTVTFTDTASSTFTFTLPTSVDGLSEGSENFSIQISSPQVDGALDGSISGPDTVETQLVDSAADIITFSLADGASVSEGAAATYTVSYAGSIQAGQTASVILGLTDGETTSGDYSTLIAALTTAVGAVSGVTFDGTDTLTFDGTLTTLSFDIDATVDNIAEGDESFSVTLDDSSSATGLSTAIDAGADTIVTTITDGDVIEFSITGDTSVAEGSSASYLIGYSGTLQAGETASVDVSLAEDGASSADYEDFLTALGDALTAGVTLSGNTLTFDSSATSLSLSLDTIADSLVEGAEDFNIFLSNDTAPNVETSIDGANSNVGTTITDDDVVEFSLTGGTSVVEGFAATYTISMTGELPAGVTTSVNVTLADVDTNSADYSNLVTALSDAAAITSGVSVSGTTVTFDETAPSAFSFDLSAIGGDLVEDAEQFSVSIDTPVISNFGSAILAAAQQVDTTITDADELSVSFTEATLSGNEGLDAGYSIVLAGLAVALTALPAAASVSFDLDLDLGSADAADITGILSDALGSLPSGVSVSGTGNTVTITVSDTAIFSLGEISLDFALPLVGSDGTEADEDYTLTISNVVGTGVGATVGTAINTTTIVDDGAISTSPTENADNITGTSGADNINALGGDDTVDGGDGDDTILGGAGNDYLFGGADFDNLQGGADDDTLEGGSGNDTLSGGAGHDLLQGQGDTNTLYGGSGDDYLVAAGGSKLYGDADNDTLIGGFGTESMEGGTGNDSLEGHELDDTLMGGDGIDTLRGGSEDDYLDGGDGTDSLFGDADMDTLLGGAGNDTLDGGDGDDSLDGQADDDTVMGGDG
ncbi:MAG: Calx-beta domain-containing protein, partial [Sneathiella sp.]